MAFPYNPDHRGYSDLESLLRGDFDAGALKLELGGELPPKPKVTWDVQTGHRSLKPAPEPQVRQVPEPVQPVPLRESPVDENTVGKPGYKFSLRGIDTFATRRLAPGEFYAPFRRPAEAPRAKGHASQLLANVNSMADEHKATIDHIMQQCDKVSRMMLLATANALRKSNAASERPMPKMTVRSHIKKELGRLAGLDEVHRLLDAQELDRPENDDILLYCSPEERQTKLQMEDFFLSSVKTFLKNERRHDFDLERVQKRLTLHSKDAEGVLNFAGHEDNGRGAARWIKNTEAVAMGALNKYETGQHKIFSDFAEKLKDTTDYMNKRMGSTGISMGSTGVSFAAPDTTVFLQPEERDMLQSLEMQKKQKEKTVWELKKQLDELIATRKNMDEVAPVSSGNTEAKMGTDQRSRHAESLDEMDEALTSLEEECLGAKKAAEAAGPQLARMVEFMATGQKNLRKLFGDLKITERKQEEARQRLQDLVLPESRQLVYEMAVELLDTTILPVQSSSSAVPASSESHKPDGTTSHLVAASKEASTQHLLAAARRRQQLRQAKEDIEAELERRRQAVTATQAARDAAQEPEKPLQNTGRNLQPSSLPASSTSGNVSELTQLAVQSTSEKLEEEQPTSPKKENQTRSKELGEFAEEAADAVDHDQDSKEEALTALERQVNMLEDSAHIRPASKNSHQGDERSDVSVPPGVPHEPSELEIEIVAHQDHGEHEGHATRHPGRNSEHHNSGALERRRPHELNSDDSETETDDVQQDDDADAFRRTKMAKAMMKLNMTSDIRKAAQDVREEARKAALEISQQPIETPKLSVAEYAINLAKAADVPLEEAERLVEMMRLLSMLSERFLPFVYQTLLDMLSLPLGDQQLALKMLSLGHVDAASPMRSKGDGAKSLGIASLLATQILAMKEEAGLWDECNLQNAFLQNLEKDQDTERHGDLEVPEVPEDDDHGKFQRVARGAQPSIREQKRQADQAMDAQKGTPYILAQPAREQRRVRLSSSDIETEPALELLIQRTSPAAPGSSGSHRPDGTTSHLVPASKDVSNQHLVAAARRRQQLRQDKGFEAELDHRRPEELQRRPDGMMAFARGGRDAAQAQKPLQLMGVNLTQPTSPAAPPPPSSTSGRVSELTQLAVQAALEKLEEEQPTSPKKENMTRSKAFTVRKRQVDMLAIAARMRASSKNNHQGDERSDVSVPPGVPHEPSELEIEIVAHQDHGEHDKYEIHHPAALERHRPHELDSLEDVEDSETETDDVQQDDDADASPRTKMANAMANAMMKVRMTNYLRKAAQDVREEARKAALEISRQQPIETPKLSVTEYAVNLAKAAGLPREEAERLVDMMRLLSQQFLPFVYQTLLDMLSLPLGDQKMALKMLSLGHVDAASPMRSKGDGAKSLGIASLLATQILAMKEEAGLWDERKLQNAFLQTLEMDQDTERHGDLEVPEVPEDDDHGKFLLAYYKRARPSMRGQKRRVMEFQKGKPYMARSVVRMPHKIQSSSEIEREPERPALPAVAGQKMELPTIDLEESLDPEELNLLRRAQSWSMRRRRQDELDVARSEELRKYRRRASRDLDNYDLGFWEEMQEEIRQKKTALFEETQERRREEWSKLGIEDDQSGGEDTLTSQALKVHGKFTFGGGKQKVPGQKSPSGHPGESSKLSLLPPRKMAEIAVDEASVRLRMNLMLFPQIPGDSPESNLGLPSQQSLNGPSRPPPLAPAPKPNEDAAHAATQAAQAQAAQLAAQQAALWKPKGLPSGAAIFQPHGQLRFKDGRSHKPDGVTSHLAAASKVVFNQHLMAAARRRRLLRQDEGFEAELVRRAEELPTSPKKERLTRLKAFTARKRQVNRLAIAARMRAPSRNNQGEETSDVNVPPRAPHEPTLEQTLTHQDHGKLLLAYHRRAQPSMRGQKRRVLKPYMERSVARAPLKIQSSSEIEREPERPALPAVAVEKAELQTSDLEESLHPEELGLLRPAQSWSRRPRRQDDVARPDQLQYRTILDNSPTWKRISSSKDREEMQEEIRQKKTALFEEIRERRPEEWSKLGIEDDQSGGEDTLTSQILKMHGKFTFGGGKQKVSGQKSSKGHPGASPKLSLLPPRKMAEIPVDEACARLRMNLMLFHRSRGESPERNLGLPSLPSLPSLNGSPRPPRLVPAPKPNEDAAHAATQAAQAAQEAAVWKPKGLPVMPQFSSLKGGYAPKTEGFSRLPHTARPALERTEMDSNDVNQKAREMLHYLQRFDKAPLQRLLSSREGTRSKLETRRSMDAKQAKPTEHLPPIQKEGARSVSAQAAAWATFLEERLGRHLRTLSKSTPPPQRVTGREIRSLLLD